MRAVGLVQLQRSGSHGSRGITAEGLKDVTLGMALGIDAAVLVFGLEQQFPVGDSQYFDHTLQARGALEGFLYKILPVGQGHEWLGMSLTGNWPQTAANATGKNYRDQFHNRVLNGHLKLSTSGNLHLFFITEHHRGSRSGA